MHNKGCEPGKRFFIFFLILTLLITQLPSTVAVAGRASGWKRKDGSWIYRVGGRPVRNRWKKLGRTWYRFDKKGRLVTGYVIYKKKKKNGEAVVFRYFKKKHRACRVKKKGLAKALSGRIVAKDGLYRIAGQSYRIRGNRVVWSEAAATGTPSAAIPINTSGNLPGGQTAAPSLSSSAPQNTPVVSGLEKPTGAPGTTSTESPAQGTPALASRHPEAMSTASVPSTGAPGGQTAAPSLSSSAPQNTPLASNLEKPTGTPGTTSTSSVPSTGAPGGQTAAPTVPSSMVPSSMAPAYPVRTWLPYQKKSAQTAVPTEVPWKNAPDQLPSVIPSGMPELLDASDFCIQDENLIYLGADYLNPAKVLFDEQKLVPQEAGSTTVSKEAQESISKTVAWKPNWEADFGDDAFTIDFGCNQVITDLSWFDTYDIKNWKVWTGEPFAWKEAAAFKTDGWMCWKTVKLEQPVMTRYLRLTCNCGDSGVTELAIYGYKASELTRTQWQRTAAVPAAGKKTDLTAGGFIGFNAFIDDPMEVMRAGGNIREYHNFNWLLDAQKKVKFTQGTWGDMDSYYGSLSKEGINVIPCFQGGSSALYGDSIFPEKPIAKGADPADPASYAVHAGAMYQVAARYGKNTSVDPSTIDIADGQEKKTGLGYLTCVENCNEPNKTWAKDSHWTKAQTYFTPYELAALCSADYDGHEGAIVNAGVKNADPDFKLAMGGLLGSASMLEYLSAMKTWFDYHRKDGRFAVDVINVHIGPDSKEIESSSLADSIAKLRAWIDANAPGTELWISEFEIPMEDCVVKGTDNHENENYQFRYAQRVARTYLTAMAAGADRMTKFQLRDEGWDGNGDPNAATYHNSGLVTEKGKWVPKKAWYFVSCMTNVLKNADYYEDFSDSAAGVKIYRFHDRKTDEEIFCLWSPTSDGRSISDYRFFTGDAEKVEQIAPSEEAGGTVTSLATEDQTVCLEVTETPIFIRVKVK